MRNFLLHTYALGRDLFLNSRFYWVLGLIVFCYLLGFFVPVFFPVGHIVLAVLVLFFLMDSILLFRIKGGISAIRICPDRFSNGDRNPVSIELYNAYPYPVFIKVIDELPFQFQIRDQEFSLTLDPGQRHMLAYELQPKERGEYVFGKINVFVSSTVGLATRRYTLGNEDRIPTYPSFIQMRKYQLMAISNRLTELGVKPIRRLGHTTEFEQIKEYVKGDDFRTINWKATARSAKYMVNQYTDEKAQPVYCLIDKSRTMKMPFDGMRLLDYAINAALVISNIALYKHDKVGLLTFAQRMDSFLKADQKPLQMRLIQELLYKEDTQFKEAAMDRLFVHIRRNIPHRSLLLLFTNFESLVAMNRQLPYLQSLAKSHVLVVIFFENTAVKDLLQNPPENTQDMYVKTLGEYFSFEKRQIVRELKQRGIISILTTPPNLTVETVNKYLEIKSRRLL
ncbi:MAG: DUF58 domain-containing protein [Bacteroidota bacterium]